MFFINRIVVGKQKALTETINNTFSLNIFNAISFIYFFGTFTFIDMIVMGMTEILK